MKFGVSWSRNKMSKCNLVEYNESDSLESENANIAGENNVDCIFYAKAIIHQ
jgi:hypothetical protein